MSVTAIRPFDFHIILGYIYNCFILFVEVVRGFAKLKKFQKSKNNLEVGPGPIWIKKKIGKLSKNKVLRLYNSPCLAVHVAPQGAHACSILSRIL